MVRVSERMTQGPYSSALPEEDHEEPVPEELAVPPNGNQDTMSRKEISSPTVLSR